MKAEIAWSDFAKIDMRIGTIIEAEPNVKARKPAYVLKIDFGPLLGIKTSSAQLTDHYDPTTLVGRQIAAVVNFPPRNIAGVVSEVLVLGSVDPETHGDVRLLLPDSAADGRPIA